MLVKSIVRKSVIMIGILALASGVSAANNVTLRPSQPTHLFFMPTARVNPAGHLVLGFHEISYGLPGNLQVQASIIDNIGRTALAAKYGFADNIAIGGGLASSLVSLGRHGIHSGAPARLGLFFQYDFADSKSMGMGITPHTQIGNHISLGVDFGMRFTPVNFWSFIWEIGSSMDATEGMLYLYTIGGLRIHPPAVPFLFIDIGVQAEEFAVDPFSPRAGVFFDVLICFKTGK